MVLLVVSFVWLLLLVRRLLCFCFVAVGLGFGCCLCLVCGVSCCLALVDFVWVLGFVD